MTARKRTRSIKEVARDIEREGGRPWKSVRWNRENRPKEKKP